MTFECPDDVTRLHIPQLDEFIGGFLTATCKPEDGRQDHASEFVVTHRTKRA